MYNKAFITTGDSVMKLPFFTKKTVGYSDGQPKNNFGILILAFHLNILFGGALLVYMQIKASELPLFTGDKMLYFLTGCLLILIAIFKLLKLGGNLGGHLLGIPFGLFLYGFLYSFFGNYMIKELKLPIMTLPVEPTKILLITLILFLALLVPSRLSPASSKKFGS